MKSAPTYGQGMIGQAPIKVAAQYLTFGSGLYLVSLAAPGPTGPVSGLPLPSVRIDPLPPQPDAPGRAFVSCLSEGQWLSPGNQGAFLKIEGARAGVVVTTYRSMEAGPAPELRIRLVRSAAEAASVIEDHAPAPPAPGITPDLPSLPLRMLAHISQVGDVSGGGGGWLGGSNPAESIEAFSVATAGELENVEIEYQALLGVDWYTPWMESGALCGSRGLGLPILGLRVRLTGDAAADYAITAWGRFGATEIGPMLDGSLCELEGAALTGMRLVLERRAAATPAIQAPERPRPRRPAKRIT